MNETKIAEAVELLTANTLKFKLESDVIRQRWEAATDEERAASLASIREQSRSQVNSLIKDIESRDGERLIARLHKGNPTSRKIFTSLTGVILPATNKGTREAIREFVGAERFNAQQAELEAKRQADKAEAERDEMESYLRRQVRYNGETHPYTVRELIDRKLADGWKAFRTKRGATYVTVLAKDNYSLTFRSKHVARYIREKFGELQTV